MSFSSLLNCIADPDYSHIEHQALAATYMVHIENNDFSKDTLHALTLHWCRNQCID